MGKREKIIGIAIVLCLAVATGITVMGFREAEEFSKNDVVEMFKESDENSEKQSSEINKKDEESKNDNQKKEKSQEIVVEIKGEVLKPDVYSLALESRVNELIEKAGGLTEKADINGINRASLLSDGECIVIKNIDNKENEEEIDLNSNLGTNKNIGNSRQSNDGVINVNTATVDDFKTLNGIGDSKASAIIDYREQIGKFKSIDEIKNVTGIGEKTLEKIKDKLTI